MKESSSKNKILIVDDELPLVKMFAAMLATDFIVDTAQGGPEALELAQSRGPYSVVISDMRMPGMSGIELLTRFKETEPASVRMLITGMQEQQVAVDAINKGQVFRILSKPCSASDLHRTVTEGVRQYELIQAEKALLQQTINGEIQALIEILSRVSPRSFGRAQAIRQGMRQVASYFDLLDTWELEVAAMVARVGEVALPPGLLAKAQSDAELTREEREVWTRVPETGSKLLSHIPRLQNVAKAILYQAKNFDGTGFPGDLLGNAALPLAARLLRALTAYFQTLESGLKPTAALALLRGSTGNYDPEVLEAIENGVVSGAAKGVTRMATKLRELRVGHRLADAVMTLDEMLIVGVGVVITETILDRLRNFDNAIGLRQPIYVEDSRMGLPTV